MGFGFRDQIWVSGLVFRAGRTFVLVSGFSLFVILFRVVRVLGAKG